MTAAEVRRQVLSSRPDGHFDRVYGLVDEYAAHVVTLNHLCMKLQRTRFGTATSSALIEKIAKLTAMACDLFDVLRLGPDDRAQLPPPRLQ
jgi:hypothetical protein